MACINRDTKESREDLVTCLLSSEGAALGQTGLSTRRLAEDGRAAGTDDNRLRMREDGGDGEAAGALDIHEEGSGSGDEGLRGIRSAGFLVDGGPCIMVAYLELVLASLSGCGRVEEINCENLNRQNHVSV